jgi:hypothetical protein
MAETEIVGPDYQELDGLIMKRAGWRHPDDYPERLYHYTSSTAFLSIVKENALWFSDFRYMNDLSELRYGVDLFRAALAERIENENDDFLKILLLGARQQFEYALVYTDVFIFCMCEENNLLNQWRVYGRDTVPLCLELPTRGFMFQEWGPYSFELVPMVYDSALQQKIVKECLDVGIEYARRHRDEIYADDGSMKSYVQMWVSICVDWCTSLKHPQFAVEKEWRLSTRWGLEHRILAGRSFRTSPAGIVPYLVMKPEDGELPIHSVTIGPCNHPEIQRRTIVEYLYQMNRANADVHLSNLPVRV